MEHIDFETGKLVERDDVCDLHKGKLRGCKSLDMIRLEPIFWPNSTEKGCLYVEVTNLLQTHVRVDDEDVGMHWVEVDKPQFAKTYFRILLSYPDADAPPPRTDDKHFFAF